MYRIEKEFCFEAGHHLPDLPPEHKCSRPHGHSYRVRIILEAPSLNQYGFVIDYGDLYHIGEFISTFWDHHDLNALGADLRPRQTTAEALACWLFERFTKRYPEMTEVAVSETGKTWSSYLPEMVPMVERVWADR